MKIYLADVQSRLRACWKHAFSGTDVQIYEAGIGSIFDLEVDSMTSPSNSFGFLDGGLDQYYTENFGPDLQMDLQGIIAEKFEGELLVGQAIEVPIKSNLNHPFVKYLIAAPTMRVPVRLAENTVHPFLATRAALRVAQKLFNEGKISSVAIPGMGTGVGGVSAAKCALQMREAYDHVIGGKKIPFLWHAVLDHHSYLHTGLQNTNSSWGLHENFM
jgi:O-acetyl-ADP-ribose deacetylase (regulator of RNase III)